MISLAAAVLALIWASISGWLAIGTAIRRHQLTRRGRAFEVPDLSTTRVVLVRPCAGEEPSLQACLESAAGAERSFPLEVIFAVSHADDDAVPTIERAREVLAAEGISSELKVVPPSGPNRKASSIAGVLAELDDDTVLINADTNVDLNGYDLDRLVGRIVANDRCGAAWSPFAERDDRPKGSRPTLGERASIAYLGGALTAFPVLAGLSPRNLSGKLWALRPAAMREAGGYGVLADYLGEDFEMEQRLHEAGYEVTPTSNSAWTITPPLDTAQSIARVGRWMTVVRAQRPWLLLAYPLLFAHLPLVLPLAALGMLHAPVIAGTAAGLAVASRLLVATTAGLAARRGWGPLQMLADVMLADGLTLTGLLRALSTREVVWRDDVLRIGQDGRLSLVRRPAA